MKPLSIFAIPTGPQNHILTRPRTILKRKRQAVHTPPAPEISYENSRLSDFNHSQAIEYAAVLTPSERSQRRLAGLSLDQQPPPFPFPHASASSQTDNAEGSLEPSRDNHAKSSLHSQHLAAMVALLHRCITTQDYVRAGRALGLLLRTEIGGQAIDIRNGDFWGIGAEILLRQRKGTENGTANEDGSDTIKHNRVTREGLESAKLFYERLIVQYPKHKTWPDAVNAVDFCTAMFGLWVYVTDQEAQQLRRKASLQGSDELSAGEDDFTLLDAKSWELEQARQIAKAMDTYMFSVPHVDDPELIRLRAMVASWTADLIDECAELENGYRGLSISFQQEVRGSNSSNDIERMIIDQKSTFDIEEPHRNESSDHRNLAKTLMNGLSASSQKAGR